MLKIRLISFFLILTFVCFSQKSLKKQGDLLFKKENYRDAASAYDTYVNLEKDIDALYNRAICAYKLNDANKCIDYLLKSLKLGNDKPEIYYNLAKSFHDLGNYNDATIQYKNFLRVLDKKDKRVPEILKLIRSCEFGPKMKFQPQIAYIDNLGNTVNTPYNEISPAQSPTTQNKYYFSSDRETSNGGQRSKDGLKDDLTNMYFFDIYAVELNNANYIPTNTLNSIRNTPSNEILQGFSADGSVMYYLRYSSPLAKKFMCDTFAVDTFTETVIKNGIEPSMGDKDISIFNDSTIVFASNRLGGFGGYDIFVMKKKDSLWLDPVNLGNKINTDGNENSPFITRGGNSIFFSSDHIKGCGGYDLYASKYDFENKSWSDRINLGLPINSPKNDADVIVSNDGTSLLLSSDRLGGNGGFDIYIAYLKEQLSDQFAYTEELPMLMHYYTPKDSIETDSLPIVVKEENKNTQEIKKTTFINTPMYFTNDDDLFSPTNNVIIKNIKNILEIYPELKISAVIHSSVDFPKEINLFFNIKRGENIVSAIADKGISKDRFSIISYADAYPVVSKGISKYNTRVEFVFDNFDERLLEIKEDIPVKIDNSINLEYVKYLAHKSSLIYKVKYVSTKQLLKSDLLNKVPLASLIKDQNGDYTYYFGYAVNFEEAKRLKLQLQAEGVAGAEIVPFIAHRSINEIDAAKIQKHPDLINYTSSEK